MSCTNDHVTFYTNEITFQTNSLIIPDKKVKLYDKSMCRHITSTKLFCDLNLFSYIVKDIVFVLQNSLAFNSKEICLDKKVFNFRLAMSAYLK